MRYGEYASGGDIRTVELKSGGDKGDVAAALAMCDHTSTAAAGKTGLYLLGGAAVIGILGWVFTVGDKNNAERTASTNLQLANQSKNDVLTLLLANQGGGIAVNGMPSRGNNQILG